MLLPPKPYTKNNIPIIGPAHISVEPVDIKINTGVQMNMIPNNKPIVLNNVLIKDLSGFLFILNVD